SRSGHAHEGAVSAELGLGPYPSLAESVMVERDLALAEAEERQLHLMHLSAHRSVEALQAAQARGARASGEVTPHHLCLTDEAVRPPDPNGKIKPPPRAEDDRRAVVRAARGGHAPRGAPRPA